MILSLSRALERPLSISSCLFCFHGLTIYLYPKETDCHHIHLRDDAILALTPISVFDVPGQCHCRLADSSCYIYRQASFSVAVPSSGNNVQVPLRSRSGFPISIRPPASSIYHRPTPKKKQTDYLHGVTPSPTTVLPECPSLETATSIERCTWMPSPSPSPSPSAGPGSCNFGTTHRFLCESVPVSVPDRSSKSTFSSSIRDQVVSVVDNQCFCFCFCFFAWREPRAEGVRSEPWLERLRILDVAMVRPSGPKSFCRNPDSMMSLERQGTLKMKKPQVISASAQKRRGPIR